MTRLYIAGILLLVAGPTSSFALVGLVSVGNGSRLVPNGGKNWFYTIGPDVLLTQFAATGPIDDTQTTNVWGATWDGMDTVYFSSPDGTGAVGPLGNAVYLWSYSISAVLTGPCFDGSCYTEIGLVTDDNGVGLRMDGLAFDNGTLYSWNQDEASNIAGLYSISLDGPNPLVATLVVSADPVFDDIKGIDATDGVIYGLDDSTGSVVTIDVVNGSVSEFAVYPIGVTEIDGLAAGEGKLYLVGAGEFEEINVLDITDRTYDPTIAGVFPIADDFSGAAFFQVLLPCDLDGSTVCNTADLRVLYDEIAAGTNNPDFDIDGDGSVNNDDIPAWLTEAGTENGKVYLNGDADLDGSVGGNDFTQLAFDFGNTGLPGAYWDNGNFDGNSGGFTVSGADFTQMAFNFGFVSVNSVPEPSAIGILLTGLIGLMGLVRSRR